MTAARVGVLGRANRRVQHFSARLAELVALWTGCVGGALVDTEYREKLGDAGFIEIDVEPTRIYTRADAESVLGAMAPELRPQLGALVDEIEGQVMSAFVRARKPLAVPVVPAG